MDIMRPMTELCLWIKPGDEKVLISRYRRQMELYRDALEKMTGKKVVKCLLYSFSLSETIEC